MSTEFTPIGPCKPVAPYLGGKSRKIKALLPIIYGTPHKTFVDVFVGMGGVFLRREWAPAAEVINDANGDLVSLFRVLQNHYAAFIDAVRWYLSSREERQRLASLPADQLTDIQRAVRFLYLQKTGFGGHVDSSVFGVSPDRGSRFNLSTLEPDLMALHERLSGVTIECLDYSELLRRYDRDGVLFYLDPPYFGNEGDYPPDFDKSDWAELAEVLAGLKGRFIMSINDRPEIRDLFSWASLDQVMVNYSVSSSSKGRRGFPELIVQPPR